MNLKILGWSTCACILLGIGAAFVGAQTTKPTTDSTSPQTIPVVIRPWTPPDNTTDPWKRAGRWEVTFGAGGLTLDSDRNNSLGYFSFGGGYRLSDRISAHVDFDLTPGRIDSFVFDDACMSNYDIWAYGGMGTLRLDVVRAWPIAVYIDGGLGGFHTQSAFPVGGAMDNWVKAAGVGIEFRVGSNGSVSVGARYARVSSRLWESNGTPAFNGVQYYAGLSFSW